jgi:uncharacterized DUF497 family protein
MQAERDLDAPTNGAERHSRARRPGRDRSARGAPHEADDKRHTPDYPAEVKTYAWSTEKNDLLQQERGVSFEDVVLNIQLGNEIDVFEHPNQERYPGQKISVVLIEGYAYLVPFVETDDEIFLKTIIPSRKATRHYAGGTDEQA